MKHVTGSKGIASPWLFLPAACLLAGTAVYLQALKPQLTLGIAAVMILSSLARAIATGSVGSPLQTLHLRAIAVAAWGIAALFTTVTLFPHLVTAAALRLLMFAMLALLVVPRMQLLRAAQAEDGAWKLGIFYYEPSNSSLMVERRIGFGYTLNWANSGARFYLGAILCIVLSAAVLLRS